MRAILALALLLRMGVVWIVLASYPRNWLFSKAPDLGFLACSLSSGHGLSSPFGGSTGPSAFLAPGYPAVLGLIFYFFGSYSFTSAAVVMTVDGGKVSYIRIALGGVGTKPWRSPEAETVLAGKPANAGSFRQAAEAALRDAKPQSENTFKIELAKRCLVHTLQTAANG